MARLLMIESWILSSGILLPQIIRRLGHSYTLLCRDPQHYANFLTDKPHPAAALADQVIVVETNNLDKLLDMAVNLHAQQPFAGVITCCDYYLTAAATIAEKLGLPSASPASLKIANNKAMMREAMARAGLEGPKFARTTQLSEALEQAAAIGYPLIVKPTDLCGSLFVTCVTNDTELENAFLAIQRCQTNARQQSRDEGVLLEEFLVGEEFSVESFSCQGETGFFGITDKSLCGAPFFVESGHMFPAAIDREQEHALYQCVGDALIAVGYDHGLAHTEVKLTPKGPRVVEINTRAGGNWISELIRHVCGTNPLEYAVRLALGEKLTNPLATTGDAQSAAIQFLIPERQGTLKAVHGWQAVQQHQKVVDSLLHPQIAGKSVSAARDNDAYLGYVICRDCHGLQARVIAENLIADVYLEYHDPQENRSAALAQV